MRHDCGDPFEFAIGVLERHVRSFVF